MHRFDYHQPASLDEVLACLSQYGKDAVVLAGGTALFVDIKQGRMKPGHVVSLWGLAEMEGVKQANGQGGEIGALTTISEIQEAYRKECPAMYGMVEAAWLFGARQIQNAATIGGNLCKASPVADLALPLMSLDASLIIEGQGGRRETSVDGFFKSPNQPDLHETEILTKILIPPLAEKTGTCFIKNMRRHMLDLAVVSVCVRVTLGVDGETVEQARISLGAVAPYPMRAREAEKVLEGGKASPEAVEEAAQKAAKEARPISDIRASARYRGVLVETLVRRAIDQAVERAAGKEI